MLNEQASGALLDVDNQDIQEGSSAAKDISQSAVQLSNKWFSYWQQQ